MKSLATLLFGLTIASTQVEIISTGPCIYDIEYSVEVEDLLVSYTLSVKSGEVEDRTFVMNAAFFEGLTEEDKQAIKAYDDNDSTAFGTGIRGIAYFGGTNIVRTNFKQ